MEMELVEREFYGLSGIQKLFQNVCRVCGGVTLECARCASFAECFALEGLEVGPHIFHHTRSMVFVLSEMSEGCDHAVL